MQPFLLLQRNATTPDLIRNPFSLNGMNCRLVRSDPIEKLSRQADESATVVILGGSCKYLNPAVT